MDPPGQRTADLKLAACLFAGLALAAGVRLVRERAPPPRLDAWAPAHRIDVNSAPAGELRALPGVGRVLAERIVAERRRAPFVALGDLARVHGIGPALLTRVAPYVRLPDFPERDPADGSSPPAAGGR